MSGDHSPGSRRTLTKSWGLGRWLVPGESERVSFLGDVGIGVMEEKGACASLPVVVVVLADLQDRVAAGDD